MEGTILFYNTIAHILFDSGSTHSFISESFVNTLRLPVEKLETTLYVDLPTGKSLKTTRTCNGCILRIGEE